MNDNMRYLSSTSGSSIPVSPQNPLPITLPEMQSDAFGRIRTSGTGNRLDVEFVYNKQPDFFDEVTNNGTVTHNANPRDLTLSLSDANSGSYATMRSHPVPYTPGNSQLIDITGALDNAGIGGGTAQLFLRSNITGSVVETVVDQTSWDNPVADEDWSTSHIFSMDFQSLKVGRIQYAIVKNGVPVKVHELTNDNVRATGYWQLASLPVYWRIYNDATYTYMELGYGDESNAIGFRYRVTANASATLRAICCTVKSEGGLDLQSMPTLPRSADMGATAATVSTTLIPLISIRSRSTFNSVPNLGITIPTGYNFQATEAIRIAIIYGGTLTGASWGNVDTNNSHVEVDTSASAISGGTELDFQYVYAVSTGPAAGQSTAYTNGLLGKSLLWNRLSSATGVLTVAAVRTGGTDASVLAGLKWGEIR